MSFVDTLRQWDEAIACVDKRSPEEALRIFVSIQEPNSKIYFNIGCLHLTNEDLDAAEKAFDSSIGKDEHLAVAFFQRGITFYKKERYEECLGDFQHALKELRGNQLIDYKALGLRYKLHACEVLHNMALAQAQLSRWRKAQENLVKALDYKTESKLSLIDRALQSTLKQKLFSPVLFPGKVLFQPNKNYVAELEKRDYLGKAKVVASIIPQDEFSGFAPLQPQVENDPAGPKAPEVLRAFEGEPHMVLFEFVPETSDELAVVPGNVVFVLQKGADNWAFVVFNERRGLVPYNYLEHMEINLTSKQNQDGGNLQALVETPRRDPPNRPQRTPTPAPKVKRKDDKRTEATGTADSSSVFVKVRFAFNIAISFPSGAPYSTLVERISKKLSLQAANITLSSTSPAAGLTIIDAATDMETVWSRARGGHITLWCDVVETAQDGVLPLKEKASTDETSKNQTRLVALHSYESSNSEDLTFQEGDTILVLSKVNQDWFEGQCNGHTGIFPAAFVDQAQLNDK